MSGKHSVYTHVAKDPNCDICLKTKIENNRTVSDYRRYSFILNRKQYVRIKITGITGVTGVAVKNKMFFCYVGA